MFLSYPIEMSPLRLLLAATAPAFQDASEEETPRWASPAKVGGPVGMEAPTLPRS